MRALMFLCLAASLAAGQAGASPRFLLRLEHGNLESHACVLLENSGAFHLEVDRGEETKVFVGEISAAQLSKIQHHLDNDPLAGLEQRKIEEPLVASALDVLQLNIFRRDHWQDLMFKSPESQQPFRRSLEPLVRWLAGLERAPHQELSEDEGKNNCLPPRKIVLKRRDGLRPGSTAGGASRPGPGPTPPTAAFLPARGALFQLFSAVVNSRETKQKCMLIADDGEYRFESRRQKNGGRTVETQVAGGQLTADEVRELRSILDSPALADIRHHEPPGGLVVRMMHDMVRLWIRRPAGTQEIILSGADQRSSGYFYSGDANLSRARPLLAFLGEHLENKGGTLDPSLRNDCQEIPEKVN